MRGSIGGGGGQGVWIPLQNSDFFKLQINFFIHYKITKSIYASDPPGKLE